MTPVCGGAIDVPDIVVLPFPLLVERMLTPGAQMSTRGPWLLKEASRSLMSVAAVVMPLFVPASTRAGGQNRRGAVVSRGSRTSEPAEEPTSQLARKVPKRTPLAQKP